MFFSVIWLFFPLSMKLGEAATSRAEMEKTLRNILGGEEKVFTLPDKSPVLINARTLADHIPLDCAPFLPFLPEVIEEPYEVWGAFEQSEATGKVVLRKRLIKSIDLGKGKHFVAVLNATRSFFAGWTFIPASRATELAKQRVGKLLYGRK